MLLLEKYIYTNQSGAYKTLLIMIIIIINSKLKLKFCIISAKPIFFEKRVVDKQRKEVKTS